MVEDDSCGTLWRSEILEGVEQIPHTGAVPGTITVWGDCARAILLSDGPTKPVLIAAAEFGGGRIVSVAHNGFLNRDETAFQKLNSNIKKWLSRGRVQTNVRQLDRNLKASDVGGDDIISWTGSNSMNCSPDFIYSHILDGGALLHCMCPWGWLQLNPGRSLRDMPLAAILEQAGIAYTEHYGSIPYDGLDIPSHFATEKNHLLMTLRCVLCNVDKFMNDENDFPILDLSSIPESVRKEALYPDLKQFVHLLEGKEDYLEKALAPKPKQPVKVNSKRLLLNILEYAERSGVTDKCLPGVSCFPGSFNCVPQQLCRSVQKSSVWSEVHPTGYYLPPGKSLLVRVESGSIPEGWKVRVGSHSDNIGNLAELRRWPNVVEKANIKDIETTLHSPFGGLVYLESPENPSDISVCIENVVESPLFVLKERRSVSSWAETRNAPGLWADLVGENIMITLPSSSIRAVDDPSEVLRMWDRVVKAHHELRGTDASKTRREWIVTDEQPVAGYMHAGYPIVTHLDVAQPDNKHFLLSKKSLTDGGHWGLYHEIGHNMQRDSWTFEGTGEVTCNIFTLHAMDVISKKPVWIHEWLGNQLKGAKTFLNDDSQGFTKWQSDPGIALFIYAQIAHQFGWDVYKATFRYYENLQDTRFLKNALDKIDHWCVQVSKACDFNLAPLFEFWKIPLGGEVHTELRQLRPFLPTDELTSCCDKHLQKVLQKYAGCVRKL